MRSREITRLRSKMSADEIRKNEICANFSKLYWHDSKLIDLHILLRSEPRGYDVRFRLDLIVGFPGGKVEYKRHSAIFRDCRIIQTDLDLLGVLFCGGDIGSASCYTDAVELEERERAGAKDFDLPDFHLPLKDCLGFFIEMIPPGGKILIFAKDFELVNDGIF